METIDYAPLLPAAPEMDLVQWLRDQDELRREYLIYRAEWVPEPLTGIRRRMARVTCSHCGDTFYEGRADGGGRAPFGWYNWAARETVTSGSDTRCPSCGHEAEVLHIGSIPRGISQGAYVLTVSRLPVEGSMDRLALMGWWVERHVDRGGASSYTVRRADAYVMEERRVVRLMGYVHYLGNTVYFPGWEQRKNFLDQCGRAQYVYPWDGKLLEGTTAENSKLDLFCHAGGRNLVGYLALWRKHPAVENLVVQGCGNLVDEMICAGTSWYPSQRRGIPKLPEVDWKQKRPAQMLGLDKEEFRRLRDVGMGLDLLRSYKKVRDAGLAVRTVDDMDLLRFFQPYTVDCVLEEASRREFWRILRYLSRQGSGWSDLRDYWNMAGRLDWDLTDGLVRYPRRLKDAHDRALTAQQLKKHAALQSLFAARAAALAPLAFEADGLLIRPCANEEELIREGNELHHCVGTYAKSHAEGRTAIFFIRRTDRPEEPYFTLEFNEKAKAVKQNRGLRNCDRTPEVTAFEKKWLAWVRAQAAGRKKSA